MKMLLRYRNTLAISVCAAVAFCFSQTTLAHTTIVPNSLEEGTRLFSDVSISHGCNGTPVRAMSILFPSADSKLVEVLEVNERGNAIDYAPANVADHLSGISRSRFAQNKDIFETQDAAILGSTQAHHYTDGYLQPNLTGQIPFRYQAPRFKADSCAAKLRILAPIANYCTQSETEPDRADVWLGHMTTKFNDETVMSPGFYPVIDVYRSDDNPVPHRDANHNKCGDGIMLQLMPTDAEINELLPIEGYWPANVQ